MIERVKLEGDDVANLGNNAVRLRYVSKTGMRSHDGPKGTNLKLMIDLSYTHEMNCPFPFLCCWGRGIVGTRGSDTGLRVRHPFIEGASFPVRLQLNGSTSLRVQKTLWKERTRKRK